VFVNLLDIGALVEREVPCIHLYEGTLEGLWTFDGCRKARMAFHQGLKKSRDNIRRLCAALREPFKPLTKSQVMHHKSGLY